MYVNAKRKPVETVPGIRGEGMGERSGGGGFQYDVLIRCKNLCKCYNVPTPSTTIKKINKTNSWFFKKINKIHKPLANMTRQSREKNQINKIKDEKGDITTNTNKIQKIIREYFQTYIQVKWKI
jgi:hypothetical protein